MIEANLLYLCVSNFFLWFFPIPKTSDTMQATACALAILTLVLLNNIQATLQSNIAGVAAASNGNLPPSTVNAPHTLTETSIQQSAMTKSLITRAPSANFEGDPSTFVTSMTGENALLPRKWIFASPIYTVKPKISDNDPYTGDKYRVFVYPGDANDTFLRHLPEDLPCWILTEIAYNSWILQCDGVPFDLGNYPKCYRDPPLVHRCCFMPDAYLYKDEAPDGGRIFEECKDFIPGFSAGNVGWLQAGFYCTGRGCIEH